MSPLAFNYPEELFTDLYYFITAGGDHILCIRDLFIHDLNSSAS